MTQPITTASTTPTTRKNGVNTNNSVILLMDDKKGSAERRAIVAKIITKAVKDGAKAIILDIYYSKHRNTDNQIQQALKQAKTKKMPVFMAGSPSGNPSVFQKGVTLGHIMARPDSCDYPPNPKSFKTNETFGKTTYLALPWTIAQRFPSCTKIKNKIPFPNKLTRYPDLPINKRPKSFSYSSYKKQNLKGKFVFVGGATNSLGQKVDVVQTDYGNTTHGVYDVHAATIHYSKLLCK